MNLNSRFRITLFAVLVPFFMQAQAVYVIDSSSVTFVVKNAGFDVDGSFRDMQADITFDPGDLDKSSITASLPAATIKTGIGMRDKHLRKYDYFDVEQFPHIEMASRGFKKTGDGRYIGTFLLGLKGTEKEIQFPFSFTQKGNQSVLEGSFTIDRKAYGIGGESMTLADEVTVRIYVVVRKEL